MLRRALLAMALAMAVLPAQAQDAEVQKLREEMKALKERLESLEKKLQEAESRPVAPAPSATGAAPRNEAAFNPGISAILNGVYANLQRDPARYRINGFVPTQGEVAPPRRGLSLGESELGIAGNIDPMFRGSIVASLAPDDSTVSVEEAFIETLGLSNGFSVRAGRFLAPVGYQNQLHAHAWDFADAPLAMKAFLGGRLAEDGVQLKWVAPTELYVDLGAVLGRGRAFPASDRGKNGFGARALFAHVGGDLSESTAWQLGLSHLRTSPEDRRYDDTDSTGTQVTNAFSGTSSLWVAEAVLKWAPDGNPTDRNLKLQGEYFRRRESGSLTYDTTAASLGSRTGGYASRQSGWYAQGVYQFMRQWRAGYRFDRLDGGATSLALVDSGALTAADFPILGAYYPRRHTFMVDWSPSEFSRVRLQLARDYSRQGEPDNQLFLQYIMSLGAHGAHRF